MLPPFVSIREKDNQPKEKEKIDRLSKKKRPKSNTQKVSLKSYRYR